MGLTAKLRRAGIIGLHHSMERPNGVGSTFVLFLETEKGKENHAVTEISKINGLSASPLLHHKGMILVNSTTPDAREHLKKVFEDHRKRSESRVMSAGRQASNLLGLCKRNFKAEAYGAYVDHVIKPNKKLPKLASSEIVSLFHFSTPNVNRQRLRSLARNINKHPYFKNHLEAHPRIDEGHVELKPKTKRGSAILRNLEQQFEANERKMHLSNMPKPKKS